LGEERNKERTNERKKERNKKEEQKKERLFHQTEQHVRGNAGRVQDRVKPSDIAGRIWPSRYKGPDVILVGCPSHRTEWVAASLSRSRSLATHFLVDRTQNDRPLQSALSMHRRSQRECDQVTAADFY
jgi:hypothetical protein